LFSLLRLLYPGKDVTFPGSSGGFSDGLRLLSLPLLSLFSIHMKLHSAIGSEQPILFRPQRKLEEGEGGGALSGGEELDCTCGVRKTAPTQQELESAAETEADKFLLDCDSCHAWFHGGHLPTRVHDCTLSRRSLLISGVHLCSLLALVECVGFHPDTCPANWHCHRCVIRMEVGHHLF